MDLRGAVAEDLGRRDYRVCVGFTALPVVGPESHAEWHARYGKPGIMIYWHTERKSACIHSQLKTCSSSEVAAMIEGVLHHCTDREIDRQYVDSHGQSEVAFAFCHLLGFQLWPRLQAIHKQRFYHPDAGQPHVYPNLHPVLRRAINGDFMAQEYDNMVQYATA